jgi:hypothetical protein
MVEGDAGNECEGCEWTCADEKDLGGYAAEKMEEIKAKLADDCLLNERSSVLPNSRGGFLFLKGDLFSKSGVEGLCSALRSLWRMRLNMVATTHTSKQVIMAP